jgi:hypothetical protein
MRGSKKQAQLLLLFGDDCLEYCHEFHGHYVLKQLYNQSDGQLIDHPNYIISKCGCKLKMLC